MGQKRKLFALLHDGTFDGDSTFYFPDNPIPYSGEKTLAPLKKAHRVVVKARLLGLGYTPEGADLEIEDDHDLKAVRGAVVVTEDVIKAMSAVWESNPGNDSAVYSCNRAAKRIAWSLKRSFIGKEMR